MDNRKEYIFLYRKLLESQVFKNESLLKVWIWCLLKANFNDATWEPVVIGKGKIEVNIKRGQFVFGRNSAARELNMKPTSVRKRMLKLKNIGNIDMQSDTHYTIVTVRNYLDYQPVLKKSDKQSDRQGTGKGQASDTREEEKEEKKEKKLITPLTETEFQHSPLSLCNYFLKSILSWKPDFTLPTDAVFTNRWIVEMDRLMRINKKTPEQIRKMIDLVSDDDFWRGNILSISKIRKQWDQLDSKLNNKYQNNLAKGNIANINTNDRHIKETPFRY